MTEVVGIRENEPRICMDCGKQFAMGEARMQLMDDHGEGDKQGREVPTCPRCISPRHDRFAPSQHQDIIVRMPEKYKEHELEGVARELFNRVGRLTEWREPKVQLWFQQANPLLGNVSPEWMILNGRAERLDRFITEAEGTYFEIKSEQ